jgi:hypothetical protein
LENPQDGRARRAQYHPSKTTGMKEEEDETQRDIIRCRESFLSAVQDLQHGKKENVADYLRSIERRLGRPIAERVKESLIAYVEYEKRKFTEENKRNYQSFKPRRKTHLL